MEFDEELLSAGLEMGNFETSAFPFEEPTFFDAPVELKASFSGLLEPLNLPHMDEVDVLQTLSPTTTLQQSYISAIPTTESISPNSSISNLAVATNLSPEGPNTSPEREENSSTTRRAPKRAMKRSSSAQDSSRKRRRAVKKEEPMTAVTLPKDVLLNITSEEFSTYADKCAQDRQLTAEEIKDLRRQRRLVKNRESAQASRTRKKALLTDMNTKIDNLSSTNVELTEQLAALEAENKSLKEQVVELTNMVTQAGSNFLSSQTIGKQASNMSAGVCLMIVLFSFGSFFNPGELPKLLPPTTKSASTAPRGVGRQLMGLETGPSVEVVDDETPLKAPQLDLTLAQIEQLSNSTYFVCQTKQGCESGVAPTCTVGKEGTVSLLVSQEELLEMAKRQAEAGNPIRLPCQMIQSAAATH